MSTRDRYDDEDESSEDQDYDDIGDVAKSTRGRTKGEDYRGRTKGGDDSPRYERKNNSNPNDPQDKDYSRGTEHKDSEDDLSDESSGSWNTPGASPEPDSKKKAKNREDEIDNNPEKLVTAETKVISSAVRVVSFEATSSKLGIQFGLKTSRFTGPLVTIASVEKFSLADELGIKEDWVLTHLDGEPINVYTGEDFNEFIKNVARKRSKGLILSFNTLLLPRLKRRIATTDTVNPREDPHPDRRNSFPSSREKEYAQRELDRAMDSVRRSNGDDMSMMKLRTAIEWAKKTEISTWREEDKLKRMELKAMFDKLGRWQDPDHAKDMTDYEKEVTDLEQRIGNLQSAVQRARDLPLSDKESRAVDEAIITIWKLKRIYQYCKKLGPLSKETRFFLLRVQELYLEVDRLQSTRHAESKIRDLKKKVHVAVRNAIDSQKPIALKVSIAMATKTNVETSFIQQVLDVVEGITEQSLKQNTDMMHTSAYDAEKINIDCAHVKEFATFLEAQRITVIVRCFERSDRDKTPGRSSWRRKSKREKPDHEWEFDMLKFNTVRELKLKVSKRNAMVYFAQHWKFEGEELVDDEETLDHLGLVDGSELDVTINENLKERWVTTELLDEMVRLDNSLDEEMEETKDKLICAIEDQDFNNFLRFSSLLRKLWCKQKNVKDTVERLQNNAHQQERERQREVRHNHRLSRTRSYTPPGTSGYPGQNERDRNPNDYVRTYYGDKPSIRKEWDEF